MMYDSTCICVYGWVYSSFRREEAFCVFDACVDTIVVLSYDRGVQLKLQVYVK